MSLLNFRHNKSYVSRNRGLSIKQHEQFTKQYKLWGLEENKKWELDTIFKSSNPIILEIGFGNGDTLIQNSIDNPGCNYIGMEVYRAGISNILDFIDQNENARNLRVFMGDAKLALYHCISDDSLDGVQIFFPDPWPKKRHHKRRIIQTDFVNLLAKKIKKGGILHLATDWQNYAEHMLSVLNANNHYQNIDPQQGYISNHNRLLTKFEQRGITKGHNIFDLKFEVTKNDHI